MFGVISEIFQLKEREKEREIQETLVDMEERAVARIQWNGGFSLLMVH